jgi:phage-related protein
LVQACGKFASTPERAHRVLYVAKFVEGVYVLHAFEKRTRKTRKQDLELARQRLRGLIARRREENVTEE